MVVKQIKTLVRVDIPMCYGNSVFSPPPKKILFVTGLFLEW